MIEVKMNSMDGVVLMTAGKKVDENIKVTPNASLILPEYNGEYELLVPTVSGVWVFSEYIDLFADPTTTQNVTFTSKNTKYSSVVFYEGGGSIGYNNITAAAESLDENDNAFVEWIEPEYKTIDFGTTPQEVSEEFYAWLTANAVKQ